MATALNIAAGPQGDAGDDGVAGPPGPGVPAGGAVGDVLVKNGPTDFDTAWSSGLLAANETFSGTHGSRDGIVDSDGVVDNYTIRKSSTAYAAGVFTVPSSGLYLLSAGAAHEVDTSSQLFLRINGANTIPLDTGSDAYSHVTTILLLTAGATVDLYWDESGNGSIRNCYFTVARLR